MLSGGLTSSCKQPSPTLFSHFPLAADDCNLCGIVLLESTPLYDASVDLAVLDPHRDEPVSDELFFQEMEVREMAREMGVVKAIWGVEVDKFVWEWLYDII